jgi:hypothetical protein
MPHRAYHLILGIAGLFAVAALLLAGANLLRHSRSGASWKQRLVSAGMMLLGALGFGSLVTGPAACKKVTPPGDDPGVTAAESGGDRTAETKDPQPKATPPAGGVSALRPDLAKRIAKVTSEAQAVADGKKGSHPFDRAGKTKLLAALDTAQRDVEALRNAGTINEGEAGLWKADLQLLVTKVNGFRPTEMKRSSCYKPMMAPIPKQVSLRQVKARLKPLLKLSRANKLNPAVTRKVLRRIEADLAVLAKPGGTARMKPEEIKQAEKMVPLLQQLVSRIRAKLDATGVERPDPVLDSTAQWKTVKEAWRFIAPLAAKSSASTTAQRKQADEKMKAALAAIGGLAKAGKLTQSEATLLTGEAARLKGEMYRSPPADTRVKCYKRKHFPRGEVSLARIQRRLPLLQKLAAQKKLSPAVMGRVLPTLERDVQTLSTERLVRRMDDKLETKVPGALKQGKAVLAQIRALMKASAAK